MRFTKKWIEGPVSSSGDYRIRLSFIGASGTLYCHVQKRRRWRWSKVTNDCLSYEHALEVMAKLAECFPNSEDTHARQKQ